MARKRVSAMLTKVAAKCATASVVGALALAGIWALGSSPARAGDDGAAPIWVGIGSVVGLVKKDDDVMIDYHERGKIVVPPKMDLPPPIRPASQTVSAWPVDPEIVRDRKEKAEEALPGMNGLKRRNAGIVPVGPADVSATAGNGPGGSACLKDGKPVTCPDAGKKVEAPGWVPNFNPLTWVGLQKKPQAELGPEPDRDSLTDPPKGFRAPAEGVGAKVDVN
jgi:hypothetical protein